MRDHSLCAYWGNGGERTVSFSENFAYVSSQ